MVQLELDQAYRYRVLHEEKTLLQRGSPDLSGARCPPRLCESLRPKLAGLWQALQRNFALDSGLPENESGGPDLRVPRTRKFPGTKKGAP